MTKSIKSLHINKAKGLKDLTIVFEKEGLTGILGPNGCGKSTILHLLACGYKPVKGQDGNSSRDYRFPEFFLPVSFRGTNRFSWQGTSIDYVYRDTNGGRSLHVRKGSNRWMRYDKREPRWVSYIGLATCVPDIEKEKLKSIIDYTSVANLDPDLLSDASMILGKNYSEYSQCHRRDGRTNKRVEVGGTRYTSLSMGAGEQRVFTILEEVNKAPNYGLILVDEIDLLLHQQSLQRLLKKLEEKARSKHLQIIFTAHNQFILSLPGISFKHIYHTPDRTYCLEGNHPEGIEQLTGRPQKDIEIYVEDKLAEALVQQVCDEEGLSKRVSITPFGSIENAFPLACASEVVDSLKERNMLFVLDGDKYRTDEERKPALRRHLVRSTYNQEVTDEAILGKIKQFVIPQAQDINPEKYYHPLICMLSEDVACSVRATNLLREIKRRRSMVVQDSHALFSHPIYDLNSDYSFIAELLSKTEEWAGITSEVREWLRAHIPEGEI